jgi:hypothetical protein
MLPTMFSESTPADVVDEFGDDAGDRSVGFRAVALAEDVSVVSRTPTSRTLLVFGRTTGEQALNVAEDLDAAVLGSRLVVLPCASHRPTSSPRASFSEIHILCQQVLIGSFLAVARHVGDKPAEQSIDRAGTSFASI